MGHSEDDAVHKLPHNMKTHWQNKLKFLVLVWFTILYRTSYKKIDVRLVQCPFKRFLFLFFILFLFFFNDNRPYPIMHHDLRPIYWYFYFQTALSHTELKYVYMHYGICINGLLWLNPYKKKQNKTKQKTKPILMCVFCLWACSSSPQQTCFEIRIYS